MTDYHIIPAAQEAIYQALFEFARWQGATETAALVYAAQWDGIVEVASLDIGYNSEQKSAGK